MENCHANFLVWVYRIHSRRLVGHSMRDSANITLNFPSRVFEECGLCGCLWRSCPVDKRERRNSGCCDLGHCCLRVVMSCMGCGKAQSSSCKVIILHPRLKTYRCQSNQPDQTAWATCAQCAKFGHCSAFFPRLNWSGSNWPIRHRACQHSIQEGSRRSSQAGRL